MTPNIRTNQPIDKFSILFHFYNNFALFSAHVKSMLGEGEKEKKSCSATDCCTTFIVIKSTHNKMLPTTTVVPAITATIFMKIKRKCKQHLIKIIVCLSNDDNENVNPTRQE